jgi:prepilin-type processing-associated H-X9-DG protein
MSRSGLTKSEVGITLAVVMILIVLILPAIEQSREAARRSTCKNNLHSLGLALYNYHDVHKGFPPGCAGPHSFPVDRQWSYAPFLHPYLAKLGYPLANISLAWDDPGQQPYQQESTDEMRPTPGPLKQWIEYRCPSDPRQFELYGQPHISYAGVLGINPEAGFLERNNPRAGLWAYESQTDQDDVIDGKTQTLMLCESMSHTGCWLACGSATLREIDPQDTPYLSASDFNRPYGSSHTGGAQALLADGSVRFFNEDINPQVFKALCTIAGEEEVPAEW